MADRGEIVFRFDLAHEIMSDVHTNRIYTNPDATHELYGQLYLIPKDLQLAVCAAARIALTKAFNDQQRPWWKRVHRWFFGML